MNPDNEEMVRIVQEIIIQATALKNSYTAETDARVNYVCIFSQTSQEYEKFVSTMLKTGHIVKDTPSGPIFITTKIMTVAGRTPLIKIRNPDTARPERGDADFTVDNYPEFKKRYLDQKGFRLITRPYMEMIELMDPAFNVRAYFSYPPLDEQEGIKEEIEKIHAAH